MSPLWTGPGAEPARDEPTFLVRRRAAAPCGDGAHERESPLRRALRLTTARPLPFERRILALRREMTLPRRSNSSTATWPATNGLTLATATTFWPRTKKRCRLVGFPPHLQRRLARRGGGTGAGGGGGVTGGGTGS